MAIPSGLSAQLGIAEESTYGTPVTVTRFYEFTTESVQLEIERIESQALRSGTRVQRSDRWSSGQKSVGGDVEMELANKSFGLWFKHMLGGVSSAQPDAGGNPTVWEHSFTPGDLPTSLTVQVGRTDVGGTTRPFTYHGCRVASWKIEAAVGEIAKVTATLLGEDEDTATGLASASYPSSLTLMTFVNGVLSLGGSAHDVTSFSLEGDSGLAADRYFLGSQLREVPLEAEFREYTGELETEFQDLTAYNRFVNGTEAALVLTFTGAAISGAFNFATVITANVRFDGETPTVGGAEIIEQPLAYKCLGNTSASALTVLYRTTDTTP
ncbi:MAG: phage tail tube protein [Pseudonocardiaceae bacterium]